MLLAINYYTFYGTLYWNIDIITVAAFAIVTMAAINWWALHFERSASHFRFLCVAWCAIAAVLAVGYTTTYFTGQAARRYNNLIRVDRARDYAAALDAMHHDELLPVPETAEMPLYKEVYNLIERWQEESPLILNICTIRKTNDGRYVNIVNTEADYNGDGQIAGEMELFQPPGSDFVFEGRPKSFITNAIDLDEPSTTNFPFYNFGRYWASVVVPLHSNSHKTDTALMVDYFGEHWFAAVAQARKLPVFTTAIVVIILLAGTVIHLRERRYQSKLEETVAIRTRELREAKNVAELANQAKSQFLATMSHELRTPLNAVLGLSELLLASTQTEKQREYTLIIRESGQNLLTLISDILDFISLESGTLTLRENDINVRELVEKLIASLKPKAEERGLELRCETSTDLPSLIAIDEMRLRQVLRHLIDNAIKFTEKGSVHFRLEVVEWRPVSGAARSQCQLLFEISDTGIGMTPQQQEQLFHAFTQIDSSFTRRYGGTGIGLIFSRQVVRLMGSDIEVSSEAGKGTRFSFTITRSAVPPEPESTPSRPLRILVAEDNRINQMVVREILNSFEWESVIVDNGAKALSKIVSQETSFDAILMDCQMPEMDGLEATEKIRVWESEDASRGHIPIIAVTANASTEDETRCFHAGMDAFCSKPIVPEQLAAFVRQLVK
ncbi:MAG: ATP-binding protein [Thermoguttaceae bacterium]